MPALGVQYDPRNYDPDQGREPFDPAQVRFMVLNTDVRKTSKGDGSFLWVEHEVQGGPNSGRKFWNQITLANPNPQAVEIGQKQLSALCHAVGYLQPLQNSDVLHGKTGEADIGVEPAGTDKNNKPFAAKNVVKKYIVPGETKANGNGAPKTDPAPAAKPPGKKKAWED